MNRIDEINARKEEIRAQIDTADADMLDAFKSELETLNAEEKEIRAKQQVLEELNQNPSLGENLLNQKDEKATMTTENIFSTKEYRNAFMQHVLKGEEIPAEFRALSTSVTSGNAAVIPTVILDEVVRKLEAFGDILPRVRRTSYAAGVVVPTSAISFVGKWQSEDAAADGVAATTASVTFSAYQLRCTASVSFQMSVRSLQAFESMLINNIADAMGKALEKAIINGTGVAQPKGILKETAVKTVTVKSEITLSDIVKMIKSVPTAYSKDSVLVMAEGTALSLMAATDKAGRAVGQVVTDINGAPQYRIFGKQIVLTDEMPDIDAAANGATVIAICNLKHYMLNTAYDVDLFKYTNNETRATVFDSICLCDGKMIDTNGLVFVAKAGA